MPGKKDKNEFGKTLNELGNKFGNGGDIKKWSKKIYKDVLCSWFVLFQERGKCPPLWKIPKTEVRCKKSATEVKNKIMKVELPNIFWPWEK